MSPSSNKILKSIFLFKEKKATFTARNARHATEQAMVMYLANFTKKIKPQPTQASVKRDTASVNVGPDKRY